MLNWKFGHISGTGIRSHRPSGIWLAGTPSPISTGIRCISNLKGPWHEIFDLCLFINQLPLGPFKPFWIWLWIREENRIWNRRHAQRCQWHCCATNLVDYLRLSSGIRSHIRKGFIYCASGTKGKLFDEKKQRSKISCQRAFKCL
jgi:hypothetical protein